MQKVLLMKHSVENGIRKLPHSAPCDRDGAAEGMVESLGGRVCRESNDFEVE